ncbi:MAG: fimbrial biogenesis outer membrane usher protein [Methyloglobulus sp.]|nr:fimbrial biogenesis outer membrane usher protein [Methyloglobulus sp.]
MPGQPFISLWLDTGNHANKFVIPVRIAGGMPYVDTIPGLCALKKQKHRMGHAVYIFNTFALFVLLLVLVALPISGAQAEPVGSPPVIAKDGEENLWNVIINGVDQKETVLFLRQTDGKVLVSGKDMLRWHLQLVPGTPLMYQGDAFYPLDKLAGVSYNVNAATQAIAINVPGGGFKSNTYSTANQSPKAIPSSLGGFLNYDGFVQYLDSKVQVNALTEFGLFNRWGVGTTTLLGQNLSDAARIIRLDSIWTTDLPDSMTSLRFGDEISQPGEWGGSARFGGIQWATNFATQPRFIPFPMPGVTGEAVLPSTVDVYVNNALQLSKDVPAGPFAINNLPVITGSGDARVVVRDLLGRQQVIDQPYYVSPVLLSQGKHNFSYETGLIRQNYGLSSFDYGRAFLSGTHRYGFTDQFTAEGHGELLMQQQTLGASTDILWPDVGVFSFSLAGSHSDSGIGSFAALGFQRQTQWFSVAARTQIADKNFTQIGLQPGTLSPREVSNVSGSVNIGSYGTLSLGYIRQDNRDRPDIALARASYNVSLGDFGAMNLGYFRSLKGVPDDSIFLTFTFFLGGQTSASLTGNIQKDNNEATLQIQRNLPRGTGFGYRLLASEGSTERFDATINLQNDVRLYSAEVSHFGGQTGFFGTVSGGVAMMGKRPFFSRRLTNSFALVHVPGIPNVRVYADNQPVGITDADGDALIPQLRAYQSNPIRIEQADLPLDAQFKNLELEAVPYFRSGHELNFAVKRSRGALFSLVLADGNPMPSGAVIQVIGQGEEFPVALKGEVFVTGMQAKNRLRATWRGKSCEFSVPFPEMKDPLPNLGTYTCLGVTP